MKQRQLDTKQSARRQAMCDARHAVEELAQIFAQPTVPLRQTAVICIQLVGACAAALATSSREQIIPAAYFDTESLQVCLIGDSDRSYPEDFAHGFAFAFMAYIRFAQRNFRLRLTNEISNAIEHILERQALSFIECDPDLHWDILLDHSWSIYDAAASHCSLNIITKLINGLVLELSTTTPEYVTCDITKAMTTQTKPDLDLSGFDPVIEAGVSVPQSDGRGRLSRLKARLDQLRSSANPDLSNFRKIRMALSSAGGGAPGIRRDRLYSLDSIQD